MAPSLYIIAGPNGAGKSLFSSSLVQVDSEIFDGDRYTTPLKAQYPETGGDLLEQHVAENEFRQAKDDAIRAKKSFAFETNFSSDDPTTSLMEFKAAGYKSHLIFMGMNSVEECILRVSIRVKAGGHKVSEASIAHNYTYGYKNLYAHYHKFDRVTLLDSSIPSKAHGKIPEKILSWEKGRVRLYKKLCPAWAAKLIEVNNKMQGSA